MDQLGEFEDYRMETRTYKFFTGHPLYAFGFGLSYTNFEYSNLSIEPKTVKAGKEVALSVDVTNTGKCKGDEVVQIYVTDLEASQRVPLRALAAFRRITTEPGQKQTLEFKLDTNSNAFSIFDDDGNKSTEPGEFEITVGTGQPQEQGNPGRTSNWVKTILQVTE